VRDAVLERIRSGKLRPGGLLPSEADLHRELGVSLGTLRKALGVLESEQLIIREPGRGTFVRGRETDRAHDRFDPIRSYDGALLPRRVITGKARIGTPKPWEQVALALVTGDRVVRFERLHRLGERAFAYELVCLSERRFPELLLCPSIPDDLEGLAQASGILLARAEGKVRVLALPLTVATMLGATGGAVAMALERVTFDADDKPVEVTTTYYDLKNEYCSLAMR
jgi:GntR family transcriptional regulator